MFNNNCYLTNRLPTLQLLYLLVIKFLTFSTCYITVKFTVLKTTFLNYYLC